MNNYVNKDNAVGLSAIGFTHPTVARHKLGINGMYFDAPQNNHNAFDCQYSAPDFLQAADWLWKEHKIAIGFFPTSATIDSGGADEIKFLGDDTPDHRNAAIAHAIQIVKSRKQ